MTDQTPQAILNAAADLIERTGWTQMYIACDKDGDSCDPCSPAAVCFCLLGALDAQCSDKEHWYSAHKLLLRRIIGPSVSLWNDDPDRTKEEVIAALRGASND